MEQSDNNTALPAGEQDELSRLRRSIDAVDEKIAEMLRENMSKKKIAQYFCVSRRTLYNFMKKQLISGNK